MTSQIKAEQRMYIKFCVELQKTPVETKKLLEQTQCGSGVSRALVYRWHKRFSDDPGTQHTSKGTGRPTIITDSLTSDVRDALRQDARLTVRDISLQFGIGVATAHKILTETLNMNRICARWVPRLLTDDDRKRRVSASQQFLKKWRSGRENFLNRIITTDETWVYYYDPETKQQSSVWSEKGSAPPKKARVSKSAGKHMCIVFMDRKGILLTHFVPTGQTVNAAYYSKVVRRDLVQALRKKRPNLSEQLENVIFHQDNAPAHTAADTQLEIRLLGFDQIVHPPYSPDLAPMDFAVFPYLKAELRGSRFSDFSDLKSATISAMKRLDSKWCSNVYDKWVQRHLKCVQLDGVYFEKE